MSVQSQVHKIAILGGGISGLSSAFYAQKAFPNSQVVILEKSDKVGGAMQSINDNGFVYDLGPRSLRNNPKSIANMIEICQQTNIIDQIVPAQDFDKVFLYYDKQMRVVPRGKNASVYLNFMKDHPKLFQSIFKMKINPKDKNQKGDKSIEQTILDVARIGPLQFEGLGHFMSDNLANPVFQGIFRATPDVLSTDICLKQVYRKQYFNKYLDEEDAEHTKCVYDYIEKQLKNVGSFNFQNGMQALPQGLEQYLQKNKVEQQLGQEIVDIQFPSDQTQKIKITTKNGQQEQVQEFDNVVSTINANILGNILQKQSNNDDTVQTEKQELGKQLSEIKHLSMTTTNLGYDSEIIQDKYKSFGALIPSGQKYAGLGLILNSCVFPHVSPEEQSNISFFLSDFADKNVISNEQEAKKLVQKCLKEMIGVREDPKYFRIQNWDNFFPVYEVNHFEKIKSLMRKTQNVHKNFYLHGNYLFTGAIPDLMLQSQVIVHHMKQKNKKQSS